MLLIPLSQVPNQATMVSLNDQVTQINIYQKQLWLYVDVYVSNDLIVKGVIAQNKNLIVRSAYLGFQGDFAFLDTEAEEDPEYTGLGLRWQLCYITPEELSTWSVV